MGGAYNGSFDGKILNCVGFLSPILTLAMGQIRTCLITLNWNTKGWITQVVFYAGK